MFSLATTRLCVFWVCLRDRVLLSLYMEHLMSEVCWFDTWSKFQEYFHPSHEVRQGDNIHASDEDDCLAQRHTLLDDISSVRQNLISILRNALCDKSVAQRCMVVVGLWKQTWISDWYHLFAISFGDKHWKRDWTMNSSAILILQVLRCKL